MKDAHQVLAVAEQGLIVGRKKTARTGGAGPDRTFDTMLASADSRNA